MKSQKLGSLLSSVYSNSLKTFKKSPIVFIPFVIFAIFEFISLTIIYFIPRDPLRAVLGPPIRTFWGERFLHFPTNFLLYPKLLSHCRMGLIILVGSLLTGVAVSLIFSIYNKKKAGLGQAFLTALKKYFSLLTVVFVFIVLFYAFTKVSYVGLVKYFRAGHQSLLFIKPQLWLGPILVCFNFVFAILIQSAFIYTIPIIIVETANPIKAIIRSLILFKKLFLITIILVGLPMLIYIPKLILDYNNVFLMVKFFPEVIIIVSALGIVLSALIIDPLITVCATYLYLMDKEEK